jgi:hypothetical protein
VKFALIAVDRDDARRWTKKHGARGFIILTPRSPDGVRGVVLGAAWATDAAREHPKFDDLLQELLPALQTAPTLCGARLPDDWLP